MSPLPETFQVSNPKLVILCLAGYAFCTGMFGVYMNSMVTTIEKRFDLTSSQMGALMGANDIGYLSCVILIAYYSNRINRSVILCLSSIGFSFSCIFYFMPYAVFGPKFSVETLKTLGSSRNSSNGEKWMCNRGDPSEPATYSPLLTSTVQDLVNSGRDMAYEKSVSFALHMVGGIISGIATCPFWNIGLAMVDDMTGEGSGIYLSTLFMIRSIAPILGYMFGGWVISQHETMDMTLKDFPPGQRDPLWVGAWWMGYLLLCGMVLLLAPFLLMIKIIPYEERKKKDANGVPIKEGIALIERTDSKDEKNEINHKKSSISSERKASKHDEDMELKMGDLSQFGLKDLFQIIRHLWTNPVYVSMIIGMFFEVLAFVGIYTFFTKYLEFHFRATPSISSVLTGITLAGSSFVSTFLSGLASKFFPMSLRGKNCYHFIVNTISALLFSVLFFFECSSEKIVGYDHGSPVSTTCIEECNCEVTKYTPVCAQGVTYLSPCHAGCTTTINQTTYGNCACLITNGTAFAERGACGGTCHLLYPYIVTFFVIKVIGSIASVQFSQILMNLCGKKSKPVALACVGFIFGIFGLILPIINGVLIDLVCLFRDKPKGEGQSFCLLYDVKKMHYLFHGLAFGSQIPACFCYLYSWLKTPKEPPKEDAEGIEETAEKPESKENAIE